MARSVSKKLTAARCGVVRSIFQAQIGENNGQMIRSASRCLWDKAEDNSATATWTNGRVWAVAMCFALYYE